MNICKWWYTPTASEMHVNAMAKYGRRHVVAFRCEEGVSFEALTVPYLHTDVSHVFNNLLSIPEFMNIPEVDFIRPV